MTTAAHTPGQLKWFAFHQNNSGGFFDVNENVSEYVFVQAPNVESANSIAERFLDNSGSCSCCGDRWSFWFFGDDEKGTDAPMIYGEPMESHSTPWVKDFARLHYFDGRVESYPPAVVATEKSA